MAFTYRFTFYSSQGELEFGANQVPNWDNLKGKFSENKYYRGVFFEYTDTVEFSSDARKYIRDLVEREGMDAELQLKIEQGNESGHDSSFVTFSNNNLVAQFDKTYEMGESKCNVSFAESGFKQKVINREDSNIDYQTYTGVDGDEITPYDNEYLTTYMHDRIVRLLNILDIPRFKPTFPTEYDYWDSISTFYSLDFNGLSVHFPFNTIISSGTADSDVQSTFDTDNFNDIERFVVLESSQDRTYNLKFNFTGVVNKPIVEAASGTVTFNVEYMIFDSDKNIIGDPILLTELASEVYPGFDFEFNQPIDETNEYSIFLNEGESLALYFTFKDDDGNLPTPAAIELYWKESDFNVLNIDTNSFFDPSIVNTVPIFESINRNLQVITGQQNSFKSTIFGKTDNGYSEDGELAYMELANGKMIRGFPFDESKFNLNFKDVVKDIINQWNLVGFFSSDGENTFFNLERFADVYDLNHSVEVELLSDIKITFDSDWHYSILKYGIKNYEYEEVNGLDSFNGEFERLTPLKSTDKKLDIRLKKLRSDDYGVEFTRRKTYSTTPTEDYRSDADNFLIDCKRVDADEYTLQATKAEDYELVDGIFSPDTAYNLRISAGRQLEEWYSILSPSLNYKSDKFIKFVQGAKNDNLQSRLIGEENTLIENADIDIGDLGRAMILPFNISFKCVLDFGQYKTIKANPHKTIKVPFIDNGESFSVYGFIKDLDYDINKGEAQLELLRANR